MDSHGFYECLSILPPGKLIISALHVSTKHRRFVSRPLESGARSRHVLLDMCTRINLVPSSVSLSLPLSRSRSSLGIESKTGTHRFLRRYSPPLTFAFRLFRSPRTVPSPSLHPSVRLRYQPTRIVFGHRYPYW